jgi:hypothetical protein
MNLSETVLVNADTSTNSNITIATEDGPPKITPITNPLEYNRACRVYHRDSYSMFENVCVQV